MDPRRPDFWSAEYQALWEMMEPTLLRLAFAGVQDGSNRLPKGADILIDWDVINDAVIRYLDLYRPRLGQVNETTAKRVIKEIDRWIQSGEPIDSLKDRLAYWFSKGRADRIAVTEVTRIYAEGNQLAWRQSGVVGANRWNTAADELVCPICAPLNGVVVPLNDGFTPSGPGFGPTAPPAHVNCRCWLTPVVDLGLLDEQLRRELGMA